MVNEQVKLFRPRMSHFCEICTSSFGIFCVMIIASLEMKSKNGFLWFLFVGILSLLIGIICTIFAILKWNSAVYVGVEKIEQKQFGKIKTFYYMEIEDVEMCRFPRSTQWLITVKRDKEKISFEITSKVYDKFYELCTNEEIMNKLKKILKDKNLD